MRYGQERKYEFTIGEKYTIWTAVQMSLVPVFRAASVVQRQDPAMRLAVSITLCGASRSETEQLPYHTATLVVRRLSMVAAAESDNTDGPSAA